MEYAVNSLGKMITYPVRNSNTHREQILTTPEMYYTGDLELNAGIKPDGLVMVTRATEDFRHIGFMTDRSINGFFIVSTLDGSRETIGMTHKGRWVGDALARNGGFWRKSKCYRQFFLMFT